MSSPDEAWLCLVVVALVAVLLFLRTKFPAASKRSETMVLLGATILFFSICNVFLGPHRSSAKSPPQVIRAGGTTRSR